MSDPFPIILVLFLIVIISLIVRAIHYARQKRKIISTVTSLSRGERSERDLIYRLIKAGIPASTIFHDLYVPTKRGYAQIDLVVPTNVGIFVLEVKDYSGWIFGNGKHDKWTQVLAYGQEKHQFYNPIKQNEGHISALRNSAEQLKNIPMYSIIVFYGSSEVKKLSNVPANCWVVYPNEVAKLIKHIVNSTPPAIFTDKWEIMRILKSAVVNGNDATIKFEHLQMVQSVNLDNK
jgi:hypothetical protein